MSESEASSSSIALPAHSESDLFLEGVAKGSEVAGLEKSLYMDGCSLSGEDSGRCLFS